jgi:trans-AT polyketide synthase, acyltransferase and oxidoreductase domains
MPEFSALSARAPIGSWRGTVPEQPELAQALRRIDEPLYVVQQGDRLRAVLGGTAVLGDAPAANGSLPLLAVAPAIAIHHLGDPSFCRDFATRYPYYTGAMANGIGSAEIVRAMSEAGMLGFFGAAGLAPKTVAAAVERIQGELGDGPHGFNLIHSPNEPAMEAEVVDIYLKRGVRVIEASAYMNLTLPVVRYRTHGIYRNEQGEVVTPNRVIAKVSRVEVATRFMSPPPEKFLKKLVESGDLTAAQAELAAEIPVAQDIAAEADSGGHTDRRPALALLPTMLALRDELQAQYGYRHKLRVGLGGGVSTPASAAAAFAMGAAFIVTGSINQACREAGTSDLVRQMLAESKQPDVAMAPAADMFEMGVTVQVLKRGTMFPVRASKLYELYRSCNGIDDIPADERAKLEEQVFRAPLEEIWTQTKQFFTERDPRQVERAEGNPKHKMALVFRWYLGQSSRWANSGVPDRQVDYQIWCGPSMGAFNDWVRGSYLESWEHRRVVPVALNILYGAAVLTRAYCLRSQGVAPSPDVERIVPQEIGVLQAMLNAG